MGDILAKAEAALIRETEDAVDPSTVNRCEARARAAEWAAIVLALRSMKDNQDG